MSAVVLRFPDRHDDRPVQREIGMGAAGLLSLLLMDRDGETIPVNVQRFDEPVGVTLPSKSPELLLALIVWSELPAKRKESVKRAIRNLAYGDPSDPDALQLHNLFSGMR